MENKINIKFVVWAMAATGEGISGGDRIFIEFARRWSKTHLITIYLWREGYQMCQRQNLNNPNIKYQISKMEPWRHFGFVVNYFARILEGIIIGLTLKLNNLQSIVLYSASDFWMDSLPAFFLKLRYPEINWAAGWYQTAPNPIKGFTQGKREHPYRLNAFFYWLSQLPIRLLIAKFANSVLVNNEQEKQQFPILNRRNRAIVVLGAIDLAEIKKWQIKFKKLPKIYEAVFQGRFHPQKGVLELLEIWKLVVKKRPDAKLVMIGDGPLMKNLKFKISNLKLEKNIILTGFLFDGEEKYRIFSQSKLVVHPAFYDSGGMAPFEAMAFELPCVGFNLFSYKYYYPKGMEKVSVGDLDDFANKILELLSDSKLYKKVSQDAYEMVQKMSWDKRSRQILGRMLE